MRYHFTPAKVAKITIMKEKITSVGENIQKLNPYTLLAGMQNDVATVENVGVSSKSYM